MLVLFTLDNADRELGSDAARQLLSERFGWILEHSRSGFTGLLVSLPTLLRYWSAAEVRQGLQSVKQKDVKQWEQTTIGSTVTGRRITVYRTLAKARSLNQAA